MEVNANIESKDTIREKMAEKLGFNCVSVLDLVDRNKFADDESYIDACTRAELERSSPEYRAARSRLKAEFNARRDAEQRQAQGKAYKSIRAGITLDDLDRRNIDEEAAALARRDLAANRIAASALGATIEKYAQTLSEKRKDEKAAAQMFNGMLRGRM